MLDPFFFPFVADFMLIRRFVSSPGKYPHQCESPSCRVRLWLSVHHCGIGIHFSQDGLHLPMDGARSDGSTSGTVRQH
jgi:hypothetical protein